MRLSLLYCCCRLVIVPGRMPYITPVEEVMSCVTIPEEDDEGFVISLLWKQFQGFLGNVLSEVWG